MIIIVNTVITIRNKSNFDIQDDQIQLSWIIVIQDDLK